MLVGGFNKFLFSIICGIILPIDFHMSALREYGYAKPIFAINMRPVLVDGPRTSNALWQYLRSGGSTIQNLAKPWTPKMG